MTRSYIISVSLGKGCYRHIQISASATLYQLHKAILSAFGMEDDHAHAFFMDNRTWSPYDAYFSMETRGDERLTSDYTLKKCRLAEDSKFKYLFDFGDEWCFQCKVLRELEERTDIPGVIRSVGNVRRQQADPGSSFEAADDPFPRIYDTEEIAALYDALPLPKNVVRSVRQYVQAAVHLYGIVPLWVVLKIFNEQNPPLSEEDFARIAEVIRHEANDFVILGAEALYCDADPVPPLDREIISVTVMECGLDTYDDLVERQQNKSYVVFPKGTFLKYADPEYIRMTPESEQMLTFLKKRENRSALSAQDTLQILHTLLWLDAPFDDILLGLQQNSFRFKNQQESDEFLELLNDMDFTTRKIAHRGQTLEELDAQMAQQLRKITSLLKRAVPKASKKQSQKAQKKARKKTSVPKESAIPQEAPQEQISLFGEDGK